MVKFLRIGTGKMQQRYLRISSTTPLRKRGAISNIKPIPCVGLSVTIEISAQQRVQAALLLRLCVTLPVPSLFPYGQSVRHPTCSGCARFFESFHTFPSHLGTPSYFFWSCLCLDCESTSVSVRARGDPVHFQRGDRENQIYNRSVSL